MNVRNDPPPSSRFLNSYQIRFQPKTAFNIQKILLSADVNKINIFIYIFKNNQMICLQNGYIHKCKLFNLYYIFQEHIMVSIKILSKLIFTNFIV